MDSRLWEAGEEPDRPYDLAPTAVAPSAAGSPAVDPGPVVSSTSAPNSTALTTRAGGLTEPMPQARMAAVLLFLIAIELLGMAGFVGALAPASRSAATGLGYAATSLAVRSAVLLIFSFVCADFFDVSLGEIRVASLKLITIALAPWSLIALVVAGLETLKLGPGRSWLDLFGGGLVGAVASSTIALVIFFILFYSLFELGNDAQTWQFIFLAWLTQVFIAGLALHLLLDPPPRTAPYVPELHPFHFSIGN